MHKSVAWLLVLTFAPALPAAPAPSAAGADWSEYSGGADRNHYSALTDITPANVGRLERAWEFHTGEFDQNECNPIVVDGTIYCTAPGGQALALDGATGQLRWRWTDPTHASKMVNRGVALWTDGPDRRLLCAVGSRLYALDPATGQPIPAFGRDGWVSLKAGLGPQAQDKYVGSTTPGTLFGDLLIMPTRVGEDADAAPGSIQAFNVRTGTLAWVFHTIPYPAEEGYETWPKDAYKNSDVGSANCWAGMAIDRARGILYVPTGSASPDFWGGHRLGQDLFANCLLALDARTGKRLWYYQCVHHDLWDRDLPAPPNLLTLRRDGRLVDAVAQVTKSGHVFVFDRVTGAPLFPIEEKPVPPSPLPGEAAWPTQPIPTLPAPFTRQTVTEQDLNPYAANLEALLAEFRQARTGPFQPFGTDETVIVPGYDGGAEWGGAAADPEGILYVNANEVGAIGSMRAMPSEAELARLSPGQQLYTRYCIGCHGAERKGNPASGFPSLIDLPLRMKRDDVRHLILTGRNMMPGFTRLSDSDREYLTAFLFGEAGGEQAGADFARDRTYVPYEFKGYKQFRDSRGQPALRPPWGTLSAIDLNTGRSLWRIPLGEFKEMTAKGIPPTGTENYGGPAVTATGLVFIAASSDSTFRVFERKTGRLLWRADLPASGFATPSIYRAQGREYVVIACGGAKADAKAGDSYVAFALPPEREVDSDQAKRP